MASAPGLTVQFKLLESALTQYGAPVYVRHEIVHNQHVVEGLKTKRGQYFVEELDEIPETDQPVVFSQPTVFQNQSQKVRKHLICFILTQLVRLVSKVHKEAEIHFRKGNHILC